MKKLKWGLTLIVIAGLALWVNSRWSVWFNNIEEPPYLPSTEPENVLLTFGDSEETSRNISWRCDTVVRPSYVQLICLADSSTLHAEARGEVFRSRSGLAAYYVARLRNLREDTRYSYRVVTDGKASAWYSFSIPPKGRNRFSFLYVGDVQDTLYGEANRFLREAVQRHPQTEFLVCGGDLTERPIDQHWQETFRDIDSVAQYLPLLTTTGNHDYLKGVIMKLERRFSLVFSYFLDSMVGENQVYTLCYGPAQFFLLDSNRELPYLLEQREWLERQLKASRARWKIVVLHHPLYSLKGYNNLIQRWTLNDLIQDYGVDLVLQGHEHAYARMTTPNSSTLGQRTLATTPVYTVSHCSPKNYLIQFDDRFDKFGISSRYYQTIDICHDTLTLAAYEVYSHTLYDSLRIVKGASGTQPYIEDYGKTIPEYMEFTPDPDRKKELDYVKRIEEYKQRHPESTFTDKK